MFLLVVNFFQVVEIFIVLFTELAPLCFTTCHAPRVFPEAIFASSFCDSIHFSFCCFAKF